MLDSYNNIHTITGSAKLAGVIGWPVGHSLSPSLHGFWLLKHDIDGAYVPLAVRPEDVSVVLSTLIKIGFKGFNITVPHKERVLGLVDEYTPAAGRIGAVNTIVIDGNGKMIGSNTDGYGFIENIKSRFPEWKANCGPIVVLGAGGGSRSIIFSLLSEGAPEIRLINRNYNRSSALAAQMGGPIRVLPWNERSAALSGASLLVNTTTLGMEHQPCLELGLDALPKEAIVTDLVYAPLKTDLLLAAELRGNPIVDGLGMLMHQGRPGFAAWFGHMPEVTPELRTHLLSCAARK